MDHKIYFIKLQKPSLILILSFLINDMIQIKASLCVPLLQDCSKFSLWNILKSAKDITTGILGNIPNLILTANEIFNGGKQIIFGYPVEVVSAALNMFCSAALSSNAVRSRYTPDIKRMWFQLRTPCSRQQVPLLDAKRLLTLEGFDINKQTVMFVSGWTQNPNTSLNSIHSLEKAYNCRSDTNFIVLDAAYFIDSLYSWSAFNTEEIGKHIAKGLQILTEHIPLQHIHLMGHSLGAHIVGAVGRYYKELTGRLLPRITGFDPARPCFNEGESLTGLEKGDAEFVDIIHSNSGILGQRDPVGDADFYPGGVVSLVPGCIDLICAHERAWEYYVETVYPNNQFNFMAVRCNSLRKLIEGACQGKPQPMGFAAPKDLKGIFFLNVHPISPFGEYSNRDTKEFAQNCGKC